MTTRKIVTDDLPRYGLIQYAVYTDGDGAQWSEYDPV